MTRGYLDISPEAFSMIGALPCRIVGSRYSQGPLRLLIEADGIQDGATYRAVVGRDELSQTIRLEMIDNG